MPNPRLLDIYRRLHEAYGPQHWWPAETRFEVLVGAVLVQNTAWGNVEKAIANLKAAGKLSLRQIDDTPTDVLEQLIRPSGVYRVKARRLKSLIGLLVDRYGGSLDDLFALPMATLRQELLSVNGVGPETADAIILYAAEKPTFVIDAYTRRVMERHQWTKERVSYEELQQEFENALPADARLFNEYHALFVRVGKHHCKKQPQCEGCPLEDLLPTRS